MKRSKHSLSHYHLTTLEMGQLVPVGLMEVLPGDTFQHSASTLVRVSPLLAPVMHPCEIRIHHWYVPHRLVWDEWEDFITGGSDGMHSAVFPTRITQPGNTSPGTLLNYLGVPSTTNGRVSALPVRGYQLIFNEWYRDQDLREPALFSTGSGQDNTTSNDIQRVGWEKDYFTAARPWTQKGPEVTLPLAGNAPVRGLGAHDQNYTGADRTVYESGGSGPVTYTNTKAGEPGSDHVPIFAEDPDNPGFPNIFADLSGVSAASVNELRLAMALQRYEEARARYGSRYTEYLRYLGVKSSDARLQRPEYLGGGRQTLQFSEVLQTAEGTDPVGAMRGHGIGALRSNRYRRYFEEHGYVFTLLSVRPKTMYMQGVNRLWNRRTKEDFWQKELEGIGQQEILNKELYTAHADPDGIFGYADRYEEYRRQPSRISGDYQSNLKFWHMAREFADEPVLNASFVEAVPTKRIFAQQVDDTLWCMINHSVQARRLVSSSGKSYIY